MLKQLARARLKAAMAGASTVILAAAAPPCWAQEQTRSFDIPPQSLASALVEYSRQSGIVIVVPADLTTGKRAPAVHGALTADAALALLLAGSGLNPQQRPEGGLTLVARADASRPSVLGAAGQPAPSTFAADRVIITGTNLRGVAPESSPVQVYTQDDMRKAGVTTAEQFIRTLPQNFGGGATDLMRTAPNNPNTNLNTGGGVGANLRGLGAGSTLTLLNGRRLAPSSAIGDFVDLSLIPMAAIERVEVLTDGASSIYGGDAVAGVINFVLKDAFEGAETSLRYGGVTSGDMSEYRLGQTLGARWSGGSVLGVYETYKRDNLLLADRPSISAYSQSNGQAINRGSVDLLPQRKRDSLMLSFRQAAGDDLTFSAMALYSDQSVSGAVTLANGQILDTDRDSQSGVVQGELEYHISSRWRARIDATYGRLRVDTFTRIQNPSGFSDGQEARSDVWGAGALIDGPLFRLAAGEVKTALGVAYRSEDFLFGTANTVGSNDGKRDVTAFFGEILVPIVGAPNALPGVRRLELNLSGRRDDYTDFGASSNPKIGLLWSPVEGLNLRSSWGTSFAPPPLGRVGANDRTGTVYRFGQLLDTLGVQASDPALRNMNLLHGFGTASVDLEPETSRAFTTGLDYRVTRGDHSFSLSSTYYDIEYEGRLGRTPVPPSVPSATVSSNLAFINPGAFPANAIVFNPAPEAVQALVATFSLPPRYLHGLTADDPISIISVVDMIRNLALTNTRGVDLIVNYDVLTDAGRFSAGLNANYAFEFLQQAAVTTPSVDVLNTLYNPIDLQIAANLGFARGGFSANARLNYKDRYRTDNSATGRPVGDWTTLDLSAVYRFADGSDWRDGFEIGLSVSNLFDRMPPRTPTYASFTLLGFDPTNASPLGRFVALDIRKSF